MTLPTDDDLRRLRRPAEDALVERKTAADSRDWVKTIVAFANSVPVDRYGLMSLGVRDDGSVESPQNLDGLQRTLRNKMLAAYPPIPYSTRVLSDSDGTFLCVIVQGSPERPHFSGPSFVRVGSETVEASRTQFDRLIAERGSKTYRILRHRGRTVSIASIRTDARSVQLLGRESGVTREEIVDCSSSSVTLRVSGGTTRAVALGRVDVVEDAVSGDVTLEVQDR